MHDGLTGVLQELDAFLMGESRVQRTFERIAARLDELDIDFALAGGLAVGVHGHLRLTVDVDLLLTADGLARFKARSLGQGYVEKFPGSRGVRANSLLESFAEGLDASVREKYRELWAAAGRPTDR